MHCCRFVFPLGNGWLIRFFGLGASVPNNGSKISTGPGVIGFLFWNANASSSSWKRLRLTVTGYRSTRLMRPSSKPNKTICFSLIFRAAGLKRTHNSPNVAPWAIDANIRKMSRTLACRRSNVEKRKCLTKISFVDFLAILFTRFRTTFDALLLHHVTFG